MEDNSAYEKLLFRCVPCGDISRCINTKTDDTEKEVNVLKQLEEISNMLGVLFNI